MPYNSGTNTWTTIGPVEVWREDRAGGYSESLACSWGTLDTATVNINGASYTLPKGDDLLADATIHALSRSIVNQSGQTIASRQYFSMKDTSGDPIAYSESLDLGVKGANYLETKYYFDAAGRLYSTQNADGSVVHTFYDTLGRVTSEWRGTSDLPDETLPSQYRFPRQSTDPSPFPDPRDFHVWALMNPSATEATDYGLKMWKVSANDYDSAGNLIESTTYADAGATYTTQYAYDGQGRLTDTLSPGNIVSHTEYNNLGQVEFQKTYADTDEDYLTIGAENSELRSQSEAFYDELGRVYESRTYEVDPTSGTVGDYLPTDTWYDTAGQVVKTAAASGLFQKYAYNGLGQLVTSYTSYDADETAYADAFNVTGDTVIQETQYYYDTAGQTVATATFQRLPDDTSTTGPLDAANSYATALAVWYDGVGRTVATANYGREDVDSGLTHYVFNDTTGTLIDANSDGIPDVAQDERPETYLENTSSLAGIDFQLSLIEYDSAGRAYRTVDNLGRINETQFDDAGRTVRTIQNYDDGTVEETDTDKDLTTEYQFDSSGRMVTLVAYNAKGSGNGVQTQATKYLYTSAVNASWQTGMVYPDSTDTLSQDSTTKVWTITTDLGDHVSTAYDRLGRTASTTDQRGVVHTYSFDTVGRLSADTVTSLGSSGIVDDAILRIGTAYDDIGRVQSITSYSDTSGTTAVNQVAYAYDSWGNLAQEWQAHDGLVTTGTPSVQYTYDDGAVDEVAKYVRLDHVTYPDGDREVHYNYAAGVDSIMSRLSSISDGSGTLASYKYLGLGQIVEEDFKSPGVKLSYDPAADHSYSGLDRFGRVVDQLWADDSWNPVDEYKYGYDRASNRTSKDNELHAAFNEDYTYDNLNRLTSTERADSHDQSWGLDGLGNFGTFTDDSTTQTRTADAANQITGITGGTVTPTYDAAGNMISGPKSGDETTRLHFVYDAWKRLVAVKADDTENPGTPGDLIATYQYDGQKRRVEKTLADGSSTHYYYNQNWQLLEERKFDSESAPVESHIYVWSQRYIDAPILRDTYDSEGVLDEDARVYYTNDANYNVTATLDATGAVVSRNVYDAYGKTTVYDEDWTTNLGDPTEDGPLYCGYWFDLETGNDLARNRFFSVALATWITKDPIGIAGGINLYEYVGDNPLTWTDPGGLQQRLPGRPHPYGPDHPVPTCPYCPPPKPNPQPTPYYPPMPNGCGSKGFNVPDNGPFGMWTFTPACDNHDNCYSTCGARKGACDAKFYRDMMAACNTFWNSLGWNKANPLAWALYDMCQAQADSFLVGVDVGGDGAYKSAQDAACKCKKSK